MSHEQPREALKIANRVRLDKADLKRLIRTGTVDWRPVIMNPPDALKGMLLTEILMWLPFMGRYRVDVLARAAFHDGINIVVIAGRSSTRTREWVCENVQPHAENSAKRARSHHTRRGSRLL